MPSVLLDTNIFLRLANVADDQHAVTRAAVQSLAAAGNQLCYVPQCAYEYFAVATRPLDANGLGYEPYAVAAEISAWRERFESLPDDDSLYSVWLMLLGRFPVRGKKSHDARLAAAMIRHDVPRILTFNVKDFRRYDDLAVLDPAAVADG